MLIAFIDIESELKIKMKTKTIMVEIESIDDKIKGMTEKEIYHYLHDNTISEIENAIDSYRSKVVEYHKFSKDDIEDIEMEVPEISIDLM